MKKGQIIIITLICAFIFILVYIPHYVNPYPVHIDEWHHISEAKKLKVGVYGENRFDFEFGFHAALMLLSYLVDLVLFYKYLPALWAVLSAITLFYVVYKKTNNNFTIGLFAMIFFASIKSNVNLTGIWFFTPLTFSIPFIFLYIYFYTQGIEEQSNKKIFISLGLMIFLLIVHPISVLFAIPFLFIYTIFHYKFLLKKWRLFSFFLIIPVVGYLYFSILRGTNFRTTIYELINMIQFKHGWGVLEINNSPLEVYSFIGYLLVLLGIVGIFIFKKHKKYLAYLLWPLTVLILIIIFRVTGTSYLSPYQRNIYYLVISLPFLSALGLFYLLKISKNILKNYTRKKVVVKIILIILIIIIIFFTFKEYYKIPKRTLLYKVIEKEDYNSIKFLSTLPKGKVLAVPGISTAIYPVSGQNIVASVFFYNRGKKDQVKEFYESKNCTEKEIFIQDNKIDYVITRNQTKCDWEEIHNEHHFIYQV